MPGVSIILPAYNEAAAIVPVIQDVRRAMPEAEIIIVDDGSTDGTGGIAAAEGVKVVRHSINRGAGRSVKDGIEAASNDVIVMLDCDGTYEPSCIPQLVATLEEGFHMVVGARQGKDYRGSPSKRIARFCFRMIAQFVTGKSVPDINSGMRTFRKSQILKYFPDICNTFSFPTTLTLIYFLTGKMVAYVPVPYHKRIGHSKVRIIRDSLRTLQYMTEVIVHFNPLKLFLLLSALAFFVGLVATLWDGWFPAVLGLLIALLIFSIGLLTEAFRRPRD
jgi:polyisoprenyl-phosphate glycosyltransferase